MNKENQAELFNYRTQANKRSYKGRVFRYLNRLNKQERREKIYEALEKYYLPEAVEYEGWREGENRSGKIVECAEALKIKAKSMYKMIEEESDEDEDEDEEDRKIKSKKKRKKSNKREEEEIDDEDDEDDEEENDKGTKKMKGFDMNDPNVWIPERDGKEDTGALQELLDSI